MCDLSFDLRRDDKVAWQFQEVVIADRFGTSQTSDAAGLLHVPQRRARIQAGGIVDSSRDVADGHDAAALVVHQIGGYRSDVAESLHHDMAPGKRDAANPCR